MEMCLAHVHSLRELYFSSDTQEWIATLFDAAHILFYGYILFSHLSMYLGSRSFRSFFPVSSSDIAHWLVFVPLCATRMVSLIFRTRGSYAHRALSTLILVPPPPSSSFSSCSLTGSCPRWVIGHLFILCNLFAALLRVFCLWRSIRRALIYWVYRCATRKLIYNGESPGSSGGRS